MVRLTVPTTVPNAVVPAVLDEARPLAAVMVAAVPGLHAAVPVTLPLPIPAVLRTAAVRLPAIQAASGAAHATAKPTEATRRRRGGGPTRA